MTRGGARESSRNPAHYPVLLCAACSPQVAEMARHVESCHAMLEQIAYQFKAGVADEHLAGMIAMTKVHATKVSDARRRERVGEGAEEQGGG